MNEYRFTLAGQSLVALGSGALHWPDQRLLCVSDLHLGKAGRRARLGEAPLPPYETGDTLARLEADLSRTRARMVVCLGDSFDDPVAAAQLSESETLWISTLQAGRRWIWIEGNHDPGPVDLGGTHLAALNLPPLSFRHIADPAQSYEISGHYHPKAQVSLRGHSLTRPAFLLDDRRLIMPAYGTYTGGLRCTDPALSALMRPDALAVLTGPRPVALPMPRSSRCSPPPPSAASSRPFPD